MSSRDAGDLGRYFSRGDTRQDRVGARVRANRDAVGGQPAKVLPGEHLRRPRPVRSHLAADIVDGCHRRRMRKRFCGGSDALGRGTTLGRRAERNASERLGMHCGARGVGRSPEQAIPPELASRIPRIGRWNEQRGRKPWVPPENRPHMNAEVPVAVVEGQQNRPFGQRPPLTDGGQRPPPTRRRGSATRDAASGGRNHGEMPLADRAIAQYDQRGRDPCGT